MHTLTIVCFLIAAVSFALATINATARINLIALGLLAWAIVPLAHTLN